MLPGLSLDGKTYFYQNPLADRGEHRRKKWFGCACCPPNVARLLAQLPGYFAATDEEGRIYLMLYAQGEIRVGNTVIRITGNYPWDGKLTIEAEGDAVVLMLRLPAWAGETGWWEVPLAEGKASVTLDFPVEPRRVTASGRALALRGQVALARGPLVYCVEQVDNEKADAWDIALPDDAPISTEKRDGMVVLRARGLSRAANDAPLYGGTEAGEQVVTPAAFTAVPYFMWANRAAGSMTVWLQRGA
ncbi:MAG: glycoside hydrolase family 127 protein [Armatimonas sp.]